MVNSINMRELHRRRIRIESAPDKLAGWAVKVTDLETGEMIPHIARIVLTLNARELNTAQLTYFAHDEHGKILVDRKGKPILETVTVSTLEVSVTAAEQFDPPYVLETRRKEPEPIRFPPAKEG